MRLLKSLLYTLILNIAVTKFHVSITNGLSKYVNILLNKNLKRLFIIFNFVYIHRVNNLLTGVFKSTFKNAIWYCGDSNTSNMY